ncbi:CASP-like protein 4A3 [Glycine max]|nr:CASP-like protein 4A3 [Glycine max]
MVQKREVMAKKVAFGFLFSEVVPCLILFLVIAADKTHGWSGDSFDRYKEYRWSLMMVICESVRGQNFVNLNGAYKRLKNTVEEDAIRLQPGSSEVHMFFPDSLGDDLIVEFQESKGKHFGRVLVQVATIADDPADKLRWWPIYREPNHELMGKLQLYVNYSTSADDNSHLKVIAMEVPKTWLAKVHPSKGTPLNATLFLGKDFQF